MIVRAVIKEAHDQKLDVDVIFTDIKQCFDSIWLDEATNDLYNSGVKSRNLNLLYEGNKKTRMCVETNFGKSERVELNKIVMQGSVPGGLFCSNQLSKLCNKLYNEGNVYMYGGKIPIPPLAMVDDIAEVNICNSIEALDSSIKTDTFIQRKKLEGQTGAGKCQWVHAGCSKCESSYKINGKEITEADTYRYLGDHVANIWDTLYSKRLEKAHGYSITCQAMSTELSLGIQTYSIAKLLHQSMFLNGSLTNMETWPNCTVARIEMFERIEQTFLRKILQAHSKTPIESLYLELGVIPFRFHLMTRRIMYLHLVLQRDDDEITKKVVILQKEHCRNGDFYTQTKADMDYLSISDANICDSKYQLEKILQKNCKMKAYEYLMNKAKNHTKVKEDLYLNCEGCSHYEDIRFSTELANLLFKFRTRTFLVKNNFRNNYLNTNTLCPLCNREEDTQEHLFQCKNILEQYQLQCTYQYNDIFSKDNETLLGVTKELKNLVDIRMKLVHPDEEEEHGKSS